MATTPGRDEYVVPNAAASNIPCCVPNPDIVSECGRLELSSSIHSNEEADHDAFFVVQNADSATAQEPLF